MHYCLKLKEERCGRPKVIIVDDDNPMDEEKVKEVLKDKSKKEKKAPPPGPHSKKLIKVDKDSSQIVHKIS